MNFKNMSIGLMLYYNCLMSQELFSYCQFFFVNYVFVGGTVQ